MVFQTVFYWILLFAFSLQAWSEVQTFDAFVAKMELDATELAVEVEKLYQYRCSSQILQDCSYGNYHETLSEFPNQYCYQGGEYTIEVCGDGLTCSALWDYSISNVRIEKSLADENYIPLDDRLIEQVCFTRSLDNYFTQKYKNDTDYWNNIGVTSPQMYFGSVDGAFRIFPARQSEVAGIFDPRIRPWYIAASSGPKNVVMILDTSGSMATFDRLALLQVAAKQLVSSLNVGDRIALIEFSSNATVYGDQGKYLYTASTGNKEILYDAIDGFQAEGGTNMQAAFESAFTLLDDSVAQGLNVNCNTAILFFTDGKASEPISLNQTAREDKILQIVTDGLASLEQSLGRTVFLFTYSVSHEENVHEFPKRLACSASSTGAWSRIEDESKLYASLNSYYLLFTLGLGAKENSNFTAWVEPYVYSTGNIFGTTVSAPVYDRTKSPPLFLGVVGIDVPLAAVDKTLGVAQGSQESLDRIVQTSTAKCPDLALTLCELESFRRRGTSTALCTNNCTETDFVLIEDKVCSNATTGSPAKYPTEIYNNSNYKGISYEGRTCCLVGESQPSSDCPPSNGNDGLSTGAIVGITVGAIVAVVLVLIKIRHNYGSKTGKEISTGKVETIEDPQFPPGPIPDNDLTITSNVRTSA